MSYEMKQWQQKMRYLSLAARLEGLISAHRIMKEGRPDEDEYDRLLWRLVDSTVQEFSDDV